MSVVLRPAVKKQNISGFTAHVANSREEIIGCQKLRFKVFSTEMGAELHPVNPGQDEDFFDDYCKHLYVKNNSNGEIVGTTRILSSENSNLAGRFYSESEFEMENILALSGSFLEIGRTCIDLQHRTGAAINALWQRVAGVLAESDANYLFGCYSIPMKDSGRYIDALMQTAREKYL